MAILFQMIIGFIFISSTPFLAIYLFNKRRRYKTILFFCLPLFLAGFALVNVDKITQITLFGNSVKLKEAINQATTDAKTIAALKDRVEAQGATIDLIASSAKEAKISSTEAKQLTLAVAEKNKQLDALYVEAQKNQKVLEELVGFSTFITFAQNDYRKAYNELAQLSDNKQSKLWEPALNACIDIRSKFSGPFVKAMYMQTGWNPKVNKENLTINDFRKIYSGSVSSNHAGLLADIFKHKFSDKDKMQFFADVLKDDSSLTATYYAGQYFVELSKDKSLKWEPFKYAPLLEWWDKNKDKIN